MLFNQHAAKSLLFPKSVPLPSYLPQETCFASQASVMLDYHALETAFFFPQAKWRSVATLAASKLHAWRNTACASQLEWDFHMLHVWEALLFLRRHIDAAALLPGGCCFCTDTSTQPL